MRCKKKKHNNHGLTIVETLIGISLLLVIFLGLFGLIQIGLRMLNQSKARITATALLNQRVELARNLPYNQVGTIGGIPAGTIPETEIIVRNNINYTVKTTVFYIDDPFDGLFPNDSLAWDYKRIKVKVFWIGIFGGEVSMLTDIVPKGIETTGGGGIISVLVFNANGQPVSQADIWLENNDISPPVDAHYQTDNQGRLFISGASVCNDCYKITATKPNYSLERTYALGEQIRGITLVTPEKPLVSVIENQLSEISFVIDQLGTKTVQTINYVEQGIPAPIPNLAFNMQGAKIIGYDANNQPIYKYQENLSTNSSGELIISNLEWDTYKITVNGLITGYDIANSLPAQPVVFNPGANQTTILKLAPHQTHTLLVTIKNASGQPLAGANVHLYRTGYDKTKISSDSGQAFFSPLNQATYNLEVEMLDYQTWAGEVSVSGQTEQLIILTPP